MKELDIDFEKAEQNDEYLAILKARQTLHVDLTKLKTLPKSNDDLMRSDTRPGTKSDKLLESSADEQRHDREDSDASSFKTTNDDVLSPGDDVQSPHIKTQFK